MLFGFILKIPVMLFIVDSHYMPMLETTSLLSSASYLCLVLREGF